LCFLIRTRRQRNHKWTFIPWELNLEGDRGARHKRESQAQRIIWVSQGALKAVTGSFKWGPREKPGTRSVKGGMGIPAAAQLPSSLRVSLGKKIDTEPFRIPKPGKGHKRGERGGGIDFLLLSFWRLPEKGGGGVIGR